MEDVGFGQLTIQQPKAVGGYGLYFSKVVRHHDYRFALFARDVGEEAHHKLRIVAVEVAGGLVGQEEWRVWGEGPRNGHALLLSAAEFYGSV